MKKLFAGAVLLVTLVGCTSAPDETNSGMLTFQVNGKPLVCLVNNSSLNSETMSCDWVAYHGLDKK